MPTNKRTIPEIRVRLKEIADEEGLDELFDLADELTRDPPVRRAKPKSDHVTPEMAQDIRDYAAENPKMQQRVIAEHFNVNPGRVSESMNHKR